MSAKRRRLVFGIVILTARIIGWFLVVLAIVSLPQIQIHLGRLARSFGILTSVVLGLAGVVWLGGVELFLHFFDEYLSRN